MSTLPERRQHRRLTIRLPLECRLAKDEPSVVLRTVTRNVSSGGVYFEVESDAFPVGTPLGFDLLVPPGDGYFPTGGRIHGVGEVVRLDELPARAEDAGKQSKRFGVAAQFHDALRLAF